MIKLETVIPRKFLSPLLSKRNVSSSDFNNFLDNLGHYLHALREQLNSKQSEPNIVTNVLKPFFESLGYSAQAHSQKGQSGIDLALIEDGVPAVIIEAKVPGSQAMIGPGDINRKAFHEAVLYFMRERAKGNLNLYHVIVTDFYRWFVFDAKAFERLFWKDSEIQKIFRSFENPSLLGDRTGDFYTALAKELSDPNRERMIEAAYFDLRESRNEKQQIALYKLFSKETLFKAFNPNDANTLNREFYNELLYIMGLEESGGGKKTIGRAKNPEMASLFENTARNLEYAGYPSDFETVLRLNIIWINRILFLKLLEAQLLRWNGNDERFRFMNIRTIEDFDRMKILFFDILARRPQDRAHREFDHIPYLNSSLFEMSDIERRYIDISTLEDNCALPLYKKTVLKTPDGKRRTGRLNMLEYLFEFLDAYDFSGESGEELLEENKSLINAAVLGLIFEKLNGYREGSYYTPGFVTMFMTQETITRAVIEKFNAVKGWKCRDLEELDEKIEDKKEANAIIDSLTVCDPAVGSGHFLVSALNTMLAIKSELRLLYDAEGKRIKDYDFEVENDELIVRDDQGEIFEYRRGSREGTRIQKALFTQKKKMIENSLFGVDINPNAAQIARLRLWIELLKHSYYDENDELVTMPNIDINIKVGDSLVSRYGLRDEITIPNIRHKIEEYKALVREYKEGGFETTKEQMRRTIDEIKAMFGLTLSQQWKETQRYKKLLYEYVRDFGMEGLSREMQLDALDYNYGLHGRLFDEEPSQERLEEKNALLKRLRDVERQIDEIRRGKVYEHAFEWRFEFPEVLDEDGNFVGFDLVIGNPPYFNIDTFGAGSPMLRYLPEHYPDIYMDKSDILFYFIARATELSTSQTAFIVSNALLFSDKAKKLRNFIVRRNPIRKLINFERFMVFEDASITTMMLFMEKDHEGPARVLNFKEERYDRGEIEQAIEEADRYYEVRFGENAPFVLADPKVLQLYGKIDGGHPKLGELLHVGSGMQTAANKVYTFKEIPEEWDPGFFRKKMSGEIIDKYVHAEAKEYLLYVEDVEAFEELPGYLQEYLMEKKDILENRATVRNEGRTWWRYSRPMHKEYYRFPKLWTSYRAKENTFCLDETAGEYLGLTNTTAVFGNSSEIDVRYVLALLNSRLLNFRYRGIGKQTGGGIFEYFENQISRLPIPDIDREHQRPFIELIDAIIAGKKAGRDTRELEEEIDRRVYALYGMEEEEISIINANHV